MNKLRPLAALTLAMILMTTSTYGQESCYQEDADYSSAYVESSRTAHWSVYIPIALVVGAAIWFGIAENKKDYLSYSDSQDGLGSIANSKRISRSSNDSSYRSSYSRSNSHLSSSYRAKQNFSGSHSH